MKIKYAFSVVEVIDWFRAESEKDTLKVLSGIRGAGKSTAVDMYVNDLVNHGVDPKSIIHLDFENRRMRSVRTARDVLAILPPESERGQGASPAPVERRFLVIDEITCLVDFERLMGVLYSRADLNVLLTISNRRLMSEAVLKYFKNSISECRLFPATGLRRTEDKLDSIWKDVLLKDVLGGHVLADATAIEQLAGYVSDRLCEIVSKRKVSGEFTVGGAPLSANTVGGYLDLFEAAYLIEGVQAFDVFTGEVVKNVGRRAFCIDPVMRMHQFGPAPTREDERLQCNAKYIELRRKFGRVYWLKDDKKGSEEFPDFVVFPNGGKEAEVVKWKES